MDSLGPSNPLDAMDPNIPSRQPKWKLQAAQQSTLKPFPSPEPKIIETSPPGTAKTAEGGQSHVTRPSLAGMPSFQRPRKRVIWRNKACLIALPLEDESGRNTNRESYLSTDDVERRIKDWNTQGYDTRGFTLTQQSFDLDLPSLEGQSRAVHPNPVDEEKERAAGSYRVNIPDGQNWEKYVNYVKEKKLRALGVDEPSNSPAISVMSRQGSSQSSAGPNSPALVSSSHVGSFPISFYGAVQPASYVGKPRVSPFPKYPIAHASKEPSLVSQNPVFQASEPHISGTWSPQAYFASRQESRLSSPGVTGHVQTYGRATSSTSSPVRACNVGQVSSQPSVDLLAGMREQQVPLQLQQLQQQKNYQYRHQHQHQHQQQKLRQRSLPPLGLSSKQDRLPQLAPHRNQYEIAFPIPHSHRHNLSENLQKGTGEAEAHVSHSIEKNNVREELNAAQDDDGNDEHEARNFQNNVGTAASHNAGTMVSALETTLDASKIPDHETNLPGQCRTGYSSKNSQWNVNAPKFEPRVLKDSGVFSFLGNQQAHKGVEKERFEFPRSRGAGQARSEASQPSKWNVAAPEFRPNPSVMATSPSREFSFSALRPSFRADAPTFQPGASGNASGFETTNEQNVGRPIQKIFGDINFSDFEKPSKSKALPITQPNRFTVSHEKSDVNTDGQEDESGRITQAEGRQKRMRRERNDGDQVPLFASSEEKHPRIDQHSLDRAASISSPSSGEGDAVHATTLDAATDLLEGFIDDLSATDASDLMRGEEPGDEDGEIGEGYVFNDLGEAASFNTARPPNPDDVARATRDFLGENPQFTTAFNRALRTSSQRSSPVPTNGEEERYERMLKERTENSSDRIDHAGQGTHASIMNGVRYVEPSYNELDAIMKYLNRDDSDFGVERQPSPWKGRSPNTSPLRHPAPRLHESSTPNQLPPPANSRSHAPSPNPNRLQEAYQYLPPTDSESANPSLVEMVARSARYSPSYRPSKTSPPTHRLNSPGSTPPSDWDNAISSEDEQKANSESISNHRISEIMGSIVLREMKPLTEALSGIQQSLAQLSDSSANRRSRSSGALKVDHSDADDEDEVGETSQSRLKSPLRGKLDQLKASISEIAAAQQSLAPAGQLADIMAAVKELKASVKDNIFPPSISGDIKNIVEEAVGRQMRGRSAPVTSSSQAAAAEKSQLQIAGLESMLRIADARANDELQARRSVEDELAEKSRLLRIALHEASEQRESAEATERSLREFHAERQQNLQHTSTLEDSQESLHKTVSDLSKKNSVLEETLSEYRLSSDQWRSEISDAKHENKDLRRVIGSLNAEIKEIAQDRQALRARVDHMQGEVVTTSRNVASDHMRWRCKEEEHKARLEILSARLENEAQTRKRLELDIEKIEAQEIEAIKSRAMCEKTQNTNAHLNNQLAELRSKCNDHQGIIAKLHQQIELATTEAEGARSRYELAVEEAYNSRSADLAEAARVHERNVKELKAEHECLLENALEDKHRSETYFGHRLSLADEKVVHYQDRISHLEEKLELAKSAAHAAVQAARSKRTVSSPSPPNTSLPITESSDRGHLPQKLSPQALRESILVLQEQLQEREKIIEQLECRLSSVDFNAPEKLKEAETEIAWLRELLGNRIEDLDDLIATISQQSYNPSTVKDAAIRLKANLQMEQQEKERALASFPSLARISNLAAAPKSFPLAAAAAWGNWRKGRDSASGNLSVNETPSQISPQRFFAGLLTPPSAGMQTTPLFGSLREYPSPSKLSARAPTTPKQSLPPLEERDRLLRRQPLQTPPLMRTGSYDLDATESTPFDIKAIDGYSLARDEEPFGPSLGGASGGRGRK